MPYSFSLFFSFQNNIGSLTFSKDDQWNVFFKCLNKLIYLNTFSMFWASVVFILVKYHIFIFGPSGSLFRCFPRSFDMTLIFFDVFFSIWYDKIFWTLYISSLGPGSSHSAKESVLLVITSLNSFRSHILGTSFKVSLLLSYC